MRKDDNGNKQSNGDSDMRPVKVALKVEKNRDGKLGKTEILSGLPPLQDDDQGGIPERV